MPIYTPSPAVKKTKIRYAGTKEPRGHPAAAGRTIVGGKPLNKIKVKPIQTPQVKVKVQPRSLDPLGRIYNQYQSQILTDDQMQKKATEWVNAQLNPNIDLVKQEADRLRGMAAGRRDALQAAYMAAAGANAQMAPQILAGFQSAASTLGGLAGAATGQVGAAQRADLAAQNQALAAVGQAPLTGDPSQQQGVENYVGGYLPATNIAQMGAFAQGGFLGQVADQRMRAVSIPWGEYQDTIADLDTNELNDLKELALKRPELVQGVLDKLQEQKGDVLKGMADVQKLRLQIASRQDKARKAKADLKFKYAQLQLQATTAAEKAAALKWYHGQSLAIDQYSADTSRLNQQVAQQQANTAVGRLDVAQQNAQTARIAATTKASGQMGLPAITREIGKSRKTLDLYDVKPANIAKAKGQLIDQLFLQYAPAVPVAQRPALRKWLQAWVTALRVVKRRAGQAGGIPPVTAKTG